jgi:predicted Zn-dependent protease
MMVELASRTDMTVTSRGTCTGSVNGACDTADIRIDFAEIAAQGGPRQANYEKTILHEIGHTVGLADHNDELCVMDQGKVTAEDPLSRRRFSQDDIDKINAHY